MTTMRCPLEIVFIRWVVRRFPVSGLASEPVTQAVWNLQERECNSCVKITDRSAIQQYIELSAGHIIDDVLCLGVTSIRVSMYYLMYRAGASGGWVVDTNGFT